MTDEKFIDHEARERISRFEGIIEEIRTRLTSVEIELRSLKHTIWAGWCSSAAHWSRSHFLTDPTERK